MPPRGKERPKATPSKRYTAELINCPKDKTIRRSRKKKRHEECLPEEYAIWEQRQTETPLTIKATPHIRKAADRECLLKDSTPNRNPAIKKGGR